MIDETLKARIDQILGTLELVNWMLPPTNGPDFNQDAGQLIRDLESLLTAQAQEIEICNLNLRSVMNRSNDLLDRLNEAKAELAAQAQEIAQLKAALGQVQASDVRMPRVTGMGANEEAGRE